MTLIFTGGIKPKGKVSFGTKDLPPVWQTAAGLLGSFSELTSINEMLLAIDPNDDTVTYSIFSGSLPGGLSLASNGTISGDADDVVSTTTFNFGVKAIDSSFNHLSTTRSFSIEIQNIAAGNEIFNAAGTFTHIIELAVTSIEGKCWGAGGGSGYTFGGLGGRGGGGGYASSILSVTPGQSITIKVGGRGLGGADTKPGGSGGGISDIRFGTSRRIIAAGGGGGGTGSISSIDTYRGGHAGAGGGSVGITGFGGQYSTATAGGGGGGTQSAGGAAGQMNQFMSAVSTAGSAYQGGIGGTSWNGINPGGFNGGGKGRDGGGGGGGRFGGGGGGYHGGTRTVGGGGGGGSSQGTTKTSGSGINAGNNGDTDYASSAGQGGELTASVGSNPGTSGRVVINWGPGI